MHWQRFSFGFFVSSLLCACSGGGDKNPSPAGNTAPQLTSAEQVEVSENRRDAFLSLRATDADGDALTFAIQGNDAAHFALNTNTGELRFRQPVNFEMPADSDGDNRYELTAVVTDSRGARSAKALAVRVVNVEFAYEFLSPLPDTIVELERYSRLPIALWMEYDYPERVQILCDNEIMNPASDSGMTWTGSITLGTGRVNVECVFWRGEEVLERRMIPVRHQHVISDDRYLVYDRINDQIVIPHPQRLETLLIDAETGTSRKRYPWVDGVPHIQDMIADTINGGALYTADGAVHHLDSNGDSAASVTGQLASDIPVQPQSTISYDPANNRLYASGVNSYVNISLPGGATSDINYTGDVTAPASARVESAFDLAGNRLLFASGAATGVAAITANNGMAVSSFPFNGTQRWGDIAYDASRDSLFIRANPLLRLDLQTGDYISLNGSGPELVPSYTLALDDKRDRLLTVSGARLLALNPATGERSVLMDTAAGPGALSGGFAGIWVAADGTHALAMDRQLGRFYRVDLRTGGKTASTYTWPDRHGANSAAPADILSAQDFMLENAKFNRDGRFAAAHYRSRDIGSQENYLDLISLNDGSGKRLDADAEILNFSFSQPDDQLMVLLRDGDQHTVSIYSLPAGNLIESKLLPVTADFVPLALQKIGADLYLLGSTLENSTMTFQLVVIDANQQRTLLASYANEGSEHNRNASISTLYDASVLALELPEQSPQFWEIAAQSEYQMDFATFQGSDQPKDFYTIDDYRELYFFRTNSGLHLCWRFNCAIQAN